ncbi:transaminase [Solirubrobacter ginsenosidimutans]|uniref:Transaminase n=1 Tax=Solirubrobacter ginsenosidimutans TaxID=490573 RepID=A0A9X3S9N1_9ACTN|nr:transaminase [Solirubrobacter ginsenosidimutans]MDA0165193.1 transaminase [Solirubrobacter ginsenosidimutans]
MLDVELDRFRELHPRCAALHERARGSLFGGVPMPWMMLWAGGYPVAVESASGSRVTCADGVEFVDLCLGDTGAMAGHSPAPVLEVLRAPRGITTMLPTEDAAWVGEELTRRFTLPRWLFTLTATDANRTALRIARMLTGRPRVLVYSYCYHGSVDEAFAVGEGGVTVSRAGNVGPPVDVAQTTTAIEFNDVDALELALASGDIACVLAEPAMTNMGIVLPDDGYHDALRALCSTYGTLLIIDETHTFSAGPGGCTRAWDLEPDLLTIGKAIGGGVPCGALGLSAHVEERMLAAVEADYEDTGGVGGTLAGNALSLAAMRATLGSVLTDDVWEHTIPLAARFADGVRAGFGEREWNVTQLGCRAEYRFEAAPARNGTQAHLASDPDLERYLHLFALNRGVLLTPFHNMALMAPTTTAADVDRHTAVFAEAVSTSGR